MADHSELLMEFNYTDLIQVATQGPSEDRERIRRIVDGLTYQLRILMSSERVPDKPCESLVSSVSISTSVSDTIVVDRVYWLCMVTIGGLETRVDLLLLCMVDFNMILGMYWLSPYHAILDCHAKTVTLAMPGVPRIKWRGSTDFVPSRVISFLKAQWMVGRDCPSYLAFMRDVSTETPSIDFVPVVRDFPDVFPIDLSCMPSDRDIDFGIDLVQGTQAISIPPYHMAPAELKELMEQL
ncbi:uncharacterized protein [Nicotiana sylvestris]|uniref:uncharacterized protein n=1 Tax=Nicotiana sylvestris TaxID=4096 RepID=UPI00388CD9AE